MIPLLEPTVIREVVATLQTPENLVLSNLLPKDTYPFPNVVWDTIRGSRTVGKPNVPNAEAHIVPRLGRGQSAASMIYFREKKVFSPTTLYWIRALGSGIGTLETAENAILREVTDLNTRCDNFVEWACWQAVTGQLAFTYPDVTANINYNYRSSHKPTPGTDWATANGSQIRADVLAWKRLIMRDARVSATDAFVSEPTINYIFNAFARGVDGTGSGTLLSDDMKNQYYQTNVLPGFLGLNWHIVEGQYDTDAGDTALFLPDNALLLANLSSERPMEILYGPTADLGAPQGHTGKFTKTFEEEDPSATQVLLELNFLPIITRPDSFVYVADVTA